MERHVEVAMVTTQGGVTIPYIVTAPDSLSGVYDSWAECKAAVAGVPGVRYMKAQNREEAEAILAGAGVVLKPGLYAFTDGNGAGGVGVVVVRMPDADHAEPQVVQEIGSSVGSVFENAAIPGLDADRAIHELGRLANILAEMAALYAAISDLPDDAEVTIVHDYAGVGAFMQEEWKAKNPIVRQVVSASWELARRKGLQLRFRHQHGHRSTWAGRNDFVRFNARADELATEGGKAAGLRNDS